MFSWHLERLVPCCNFLCSVGKLSTRKLMSTFSRSPFISRKKSEMASKPSSPRTKRNSNPHSLKDPVSKPNSSVNNTNSNGRAVRRTIPVSVLPSRPNTIQKKTETTYSSTFTGSSARASVTDLTGETQYYQPPSLSSARQSRQRQKTVKVTLSPRDVTKNLEQLKLSPPRTLPPTPKSTPSSSINSLPTEVCAGSRHSPSQSKSNSPLPHQRSQSLSFSQVSSQQEKGLASKQNQSMNFASKNQTSSAQPQAFFMDLPKYSKQKILTDKQSQSMDMSYSSKSGSILTKSQSHPSTFHGIWTIQPEILVDVTPPFYGGNYPLATSRHTSSSEPTLQTSSGSLTSYEHPRLSWSSGYKSNTPSPSPSPSRSPSPSSIMKFESKGSASSFKSLSSTSSNVTAVTKSTVSPVHAPMTQSLSSQFDKNDIPVVKVGISGVVDPVRNGLVGLRNVGNTVSLLSVH